MDTKKKFCCTHCNYSTKYNYDLKRHTKAKHSTKNKFNCDLCTFSTNYKRSLLRHTEVKHKCEKKTAKKIAKKCFWLPVFYTVQILENSPKKVVKNEKLSSKHEDK